jgi:hypothetical protein
MEGCASRVQGDAMTMKVRRSAEGTVVTLALSGRIEGGDVAELQRLVEAEADGQNVVLDLMEVELVGRETVRLLARFETDGIKLQNCPPYVREWIRREGSGTPQY